MLSLSQLTRLLSCASVTLALVLVLSGCASHTTIGTKPAQSSLTSVTVSPATGNLTAGAKLQLKAAAGYSDGTVVALISGVTWKSSSPNIATVDSNGNVLGVAAGSATITATFQGVSGTASLQVTAQVKTLSSIAVSPATATLQTGATIQLTATGSYSDGSTADITTQAVWTSANSAVASVDARGNVTGVAAGSATVIATLQGVSNSATLQVTAPARTLGSIAVSPVTSTLQTGATGQFTATATYSDGTSAPLFSGVTWSSSNTAVATVDASGKATSVAAGTATITATYQELSSSATLQVTAPAKTLSSIAVSPATATLDEGSELQFTATGTYSDGSTADITLQSAWNSADTSLLTVDAKGMATAIAEGSTTLSATLDNVTGSASVAINHPKPQSVVIDPASVQLPIGDTQQLTATVNYNDGTSKDVTSSATWTVGNSAVASVSTSGLLTASASGSTTVTASIDGTTSSQPVQVTTPSKSAVNISTWHVDTNRSGLNSSEISLAPANVTPDHFGKLFSDQVDGYVYGSPLVMSNITVGGASHNVVYVATENDSVYAFDADSSSAPLWKVSLLKPGESPLTAAPIKPVEGVTSTPVIDPSTGTLYVVSAQTSRSTGGTFRLNALDLVTGAQKFGGPVTLQASTPGTGNGSVGGEVTLTTSCTQRAALLLANNTVYIGFGSCARGWLLAYDAQSLAQVGAFTSSPDLNGEGEYASAGGIWMGGAGPAADNSGNVYAVTGNGPWDGKTAWSDSILKFSPKLQMLDYFTPQDYQYMDCADSDLASGGLLLIPGTSKALAGGKQGKLFLVDTNNLGQEQPGDAGATQTLWFESDLSAPYSQSCTDASGTHTAQSNSYEIFGTAAYFDGSVYLGVTPTSSSAPAGLRQFTYSGNLTPGPHSDPSIQQNTRGTSPFISANGTSGGIVWMIDTGHPIQSSGGDPVTPAILRAYDPAQFPRELYNSSTNPNDVAGYGIKFSSPVVANGKVYISTGHDLPTDSNPQGEIDVFGLK